MQALIDYQVATDARFAATDGKISDVKTEVMKKVTAVEKEVTAMSSKLNEVANMTHQMFATQKNTDTVLSQIAQSIAQREPGKLPSQGEVSKATCNAIFMRPMTLRGGKAVEPRQNPSQGERKDAKDKHERTMGENQEDEQKVRMEQEYQEGLETDIEDMDDDDVEPILVERKEEPKKMQDIDNKHVGKKKWELIQEIKELKRELAEKKDRKVEIKDIPFPQRFKSKKDDIEFAQFMNVIGQIDVNMPLVEAITKIPSYGRFLKDIMSKKRKMEDVSFAQCRSITEGFMTTKCKDEGECTLPCQIGSLTVLHGLCDLGSSINLMPLTIFKQLGLNIMKPVKMAVQFADKSTKYPLGVAENILVKVGKLIYPVDFVIMDVQADPCVPLILGRPFLYTSKAVINMGEGDITLYMIDSTETFEFEVDRFQFGGPTLLTKSEEWCSQMDQKEADMSVLVEKEGDKGISEKKRTEKTKGVKFKAEKVAGVGRSENETWKAEEFLKENWARMNKLGECNVITFEEESTGVVEEMLEYGKPPKCEDGRENLEVG